MSGPTAFQTQYRQEFIAGFEARQSQLRSCCVTETVIKGNTATFLVADSGSATAVTRGTNGLIPARADNLTQSSATLAEWHDLVRKTGFNVFASQGDQRRIMQETTMAVINRKIDLDIIAQLDTATNDTGGYATASLSMVAKSKAILGINYVPTSEVDNLFAIVTPAFMAYLMQIKEFSSANYVDAKPFTGRPGQMLRWYGVNWIESPLLTGVGGASEKCYMFHRNAIGHAVNTGDLQSVVGYDDEQDYSYARCSTFMGSKLLQNSGVVQMKHDGSAYVAS
jgi:hypothetical protein